MKLMAKFVMTMREDGKMKVATTMPVGTMSNGKMMMVTGLTNNGNARVQALPQRESAHDGWREGS